MNFFRLVHKSLFEVLFKRRFGCVLRVRRFYVSRRKTVRPRKDVFTRGRKGAKGGTLQRAPKYV